MTEDKFLTFQKFNAIKDAFDLILLLKAHGVIFQIEDASPPVDITFSGNTLQNEFRVKIRQSDFDLVNQILEKQAVENIKHYSNDHYLYDFSDIELLEIVERPDEWSREDYLLSQKILKTRGLEISNEKVEELKMKRIEELHKAVKGNQDWLYFGFVSAVLGGLLGVFIGWFHWTSKKNDPSGLKLYTYDDKTRKSGKQIFWLGIISFIIWLISSFN